MFSMRRQDTLRRVRSGDEALLQMQLTNSIGLQMQAPFAFEFCTQLVPA